MDDEKTLFIAIILMTSIFMFLLGYIMCVTNYNIDNQNYNDININKNMYKYENINTTIMLKYKETEYYENGQIKKEIIKVVGK